MKSILQAKEIPISQIDLTDDTYNLTPLSGQEISDSLRNSIARVGILRPPIVKAKKLKSFMLVSGRKRLAAAQETLSLKFCNCLTLPSDIPEAETFMILLEDRLLSGTINAVEQAVFLKKILSFMDEKLAAENFLPRLGLPPHPFHIKRLLSLLDLEEELIQDLLLDRLDTKTAIELSELSPHDRMAIFSLISTLKLSTGKQKKLLAVCRELAVRNDCSITDILADDDLAQILAHPAANKPQMATRMMSWLDEKKYPRLGKAEKEFRKFCHGLGLPDTAELKHSPNFEKDSLVLTLSFKNQGEFINAWQKIKPALNKTIRRQS